MDVGQLGCKKDAHELFLIKEPLEISFKLYSHGCPKMLDSHPHLPGTM